MNSEKSLEDAFFEYEVHLNKLAFERQFNYGVFYAYVKVEGTRDSKHCMDRRMYSARSKAKDQSIYPNFLSVKILQ